MDGDRLVAELAAGGVAVKTPAPTMGKLQKISYTHDALIDAIIQDPHRSQGEFAAMFGYSESWLSNILASGAFQARMAQRRAEIIDPGLAASVKERFEALVRRSLDVLMKKLDATQVSDQVAIRAAELGAKALGIGGHGPQGEKPDTAADRLERLAHRLIDLKTPGRVIEHGSVQDADPA